MKVRRNVSKYHDWRYVYGTREGKWFLVGPRDRDYESALTKEQIQELGPEKAKALYLAPTFIKPKRNPSHRLHGFRNLGNSLRPEFIPHSAGRLCGKSKPRRNPLPAIGLMGWLVLGGGAVLLTDFVIGKFRGKESAVGGLFASLGGIGRSMPYLAAAIAIAMTGKYLVPKEQKGVQVATAIGTLGLTGAGVYKMIGEK